MVNGHEIISETLDNCVEMEETKYKRKSKDSCFSCCGGDADQYEDVEKVPLKDTEGEVKKDAIGINFDTIAAGQNDAKIFTQMKVIDDLLAFRTSMAKPIQKEAVYGEYFSSRHLTFSQFWTPITYPQ